MVFCATCNEHSDSVRRHEKSRCQQWHSAVSCCCYCVPPQAAKQCCCHCHHCLIRGSSGRASMVACSGASSNSSSGSSGGRGNAILSFVVVVILLLLACPPGRHHPSPFCCPLLIPQAVACPSSTCNGWLLFALSAVLFVVARHPLIIDYCVASRRPTAHLIALVSSAAGASRCSLVLQGIVVAAVTVMLSSLMLPQHQRRPTMLVPSDAVVVIVVTGGGTGLRAGPPVTPLSWLSFVKQ